MFRQPHFSCIVKKHSLNIFELLMGFKLIWEIFSAVCVLNAPFRGGLVIRDCSCKMPTRAFFQGDFWAELFNISLKVNSLYSGRSKRISDDEDVERSSEHALRVNRLLSQLGCDLESRLCWHKKKQQEGINCHIIVFGN